MDLHLYPTALSRDGALREAARRRGVLFDHRHFTYPELCERLYRSEGLPGQLIDNPAQTVFLRHSIAARLGEAPSPGLVAEYRSVFDELKGVGLDAAEFAHCVALIAPEVPEHVRLTLQPPLDVWQHYQRGLDQAKLVLATTKDRQHRLYLGHGMYGEVTLRFTGGRFEPWEWTYPDYRTPEYRVFFEMVRRRYRQQLAARVAEPDHV